MWYMQPSGFLNPWPLKLIWMLFSLPLEPSHRSEKIYPNHQQSPYMPFSHSHWRELCVHLHAWTKHYICWYQPLACHTEACLPQSFNQYNARYELHRIGYLVLIIFSVVTTLPCSTLIFNFLTTSVRHKCAAIFLTTTSLIISFFSYPC
jgi:hypothetical protein